MRVIRDLRQCCHNVIVGLFVENEVDLRENYIRFLVVPKIARADVLEPFVLKIVGNARLALCVASKISRQRTQTEIVQRAVAAGMDGIALTDHQSARNTPAIAECARRAGLACLYGLEVCTAEEVHTLALFDDVEQALAQLD